MLLRSANKKKLPEEKKENEVPVVKKRACRKKKTPEKPQTVNISFNIQITGNKPGTSGQLPSQPIVLHIGDLMQKSLDSELLSQDLRVNIQGDLGNRSQNHSLNLSQPCSCMSNGKDVSEQTTQVETNDSVNYGDFQPDMKSSGTKEPHKRTCTEIYSDDSDLFESPERIFKKRKDAQKKNNSMSNTEESQTASQQEIEQDNVITSSQNQTLHIASDHGGCTDSMGLKIISPIKFNENNLCIDNSFLQALMSDRDSNIIDAPSQDLPTDLELEPLVKEADLSVCSVRLIDISKNKNDLNSQKKLTNKTVSNSNQSKKLKEAHKNKEIVRHKVLRKRKMYKSKDSYISSTDSECEIKTSPRRNLVSEQENKWVIKSESHQTNGNTGNSEHAHSSSTCFRDNADKSSNQKSMKEFNSSSKTEQKLSHIDKQKSRSESYSSDVSIISTNSNAVRVAVGNTNNLLVDKPKCKENIPSTDSENSAHKIKTRLVERKQVDDPKIILPEKPLKSKVCATKSSSKDNGSIEGNGLDKNKNASPRKHDQANGQSDKNSSKPIAESRHFHDGTDDSTSSDDESSGKSDPTETNVSITASNESKSNGKDQSRDDSKSSGVLLQRMKKCLLNGANGRRKENKRRSTSKDSSDSNNIGERESTARKKTSKPPDSNSSSNSSDENINKNKKLDGSSPCAEKNGTLSDKKAKPAVTAANGESSSSGDSSLLSEEESSPLSDENKTVQSKNIQWRVESKLKSSASNEKQSSSSDSSDEDLVENQEVCAPSTLDQKISNTSGEKTELTVVAANGKSSSSDDSSSSEDENSPLTTENKTVPSKNVQKGVELKLKSSTSNGKQSSSSDSSDEELFENQEVCAPSTLDQKISNTSGEKTELTVVAANGKSSSSDDSSSSEDENSPLTTENKTVPSKNVQKGVESELKTSISNVKQSSNSDSSDEDANGKSSSSDNSSSSEDENSPLITENKTVPSKNIQRDVESKLKSSTSNGKQSSSSDSSDEELFEKKKIAVSKTLDFEDVFADSENDTKEQQNGKNRNSKLACDSKKYSASSDDSDSNESSENMDENIPPVKSSSSSTKSEKEKGEIVSMRPVQKKSTSQENGSPDDSSKVKNKGMSLSVPGQRMDETENDELIKKHLEEIRRKYKIKVPKPPKKPKPTRRERESSVDTVIFNPPPFPITDKISETKPLAKIKRVLESAKSSQGTSSKPKKKKMDLDENFISLESSGSTKFSVAALEKFEVKAPVSAANFKSKMLFGSDRVKRMASSALEVGKKKQAVHQRQN